MNIPTSNYLPALMLVTLLSACHPVHPTDSDGASPALLGSASQPDAYAPPVQLQTPAAVLASVNKNYNETTTTCQQYGTSAERGAYYCSGVLVRTVDNGPFNPWSYSPTAIAIGATSYSWIRQDTGITGLYHPAGFILRNRVDAIAAGVPGLATGFICMYPYDASTRTTNGHQGCGLRPRNTAPQADNENGAYTWGSCDTIGVNTTAQWNADFTSHGNNFSKQCSWSVDKPSAWPSMIASRQTFGRNDVWNEVLLNNYKDGDAMPPYISAFFYDVKKAGSLAIAQDFQRKLSAAGYNVPILRLDFTAAAANRFAYEVADQVIPQ